MRKLEIYVNAWEEIFLSELAEKLRPDGDEVPPLEVAASYALRVGMGAAARELRGQGASPSRAPAL